jgi:outer membrane protein OmpA-like peptidoglycan-associated protein
MLVNKTVLALCAGLIGATGCAHDRPARDRASVSAVTNREVAENADAEGKTRQHYTEVGEEQALGRDNETHSTLAEGSGATAGQTVPGINAPSCELAVYFDSDSAKLKEGAEESLDRVAECMKRKEVDHATIVGQTDPSGTAKHNDQLGLERARVVAEYLKGRGVPEGDIRVRSKGEVASAQGRELWPVARQAGVDVSR